MPEKRLLQIGDLIVQRLGLHTKDDKHFMLRVDRITPTSVQFSNVGHGRGSSSRRFTYNLSMVQSDMTYKNGDRITVA